MQHSLKVLGADQGARNSLGRRIVNDRGKLLSLRFVNIAGGSFSKPRTHSEQPVGDILVAGAGHVERTCVNLLLVLTRHVLVDWSLRRRHVRHEVPVTDKVLHNRTAEQRE